MVTEKISYLDFNVNYLGTQKLVVTRWKIFLRNLTRNQISTEYRYIETLD